MERDYNRVEREDRESAWQRAIDAVGTNSVAAWTARRWLSCAPGRWTDRVTV